MKLIKRIKNVFGLIKTEKLSTERLNESIVINVSPNDCIIKTGTLYIEKSSNNITSSLVTYFSNHNIQKQIICCQILVEKDIQGSQCRFVSPVIEQNSTTVKQKLEHNNGVKIIVLTVDYSQYYFDLGFLNSTYNSIIIQTNES
jgi:hypothetical protein